MQRKKTKSRERKSLATENSITPHSPLFFHSPLQKFHSPYGEPSPVKNHCFTQQLTNSLLAYLIVSLPIRSWNLYVVIGTTSSFIFIHNACKIRKHAVQIVSSRGISACQPITPVWRLKSNIIQNVSDTRLNSGVDLDCEDLPCV